ncbi:hypothetical protein GYMLUDRAFT_94388 [Collybiopsis luxurians FD-317 M1]|nr:hypothetical protein GYMLUDRAFT_94388 [Collybiopsis luxurians FD-317 M1]
MPVQHPEYPKLKNRFFQPAELYQEIWLEHWGEPLKRSHNNKMITVNRELFNRSRVWVMDDYARMMDIINNEIRKGSESCLILGSPGIGKSVFLVYCLALRLSKQLPTIYHKGETHFFDETGAYIITGGPADVQRFRPFQGILALVDSDMNAVPTKFWMSYRIFPVLASSPQETRYKELNKQTWTTKKIIAKIPTFTEAMSVWQSQLPEENICNQKAELAEIWTNYGLNFRLGASYLWDALDPGS